MFWADIKNKITDVVRCDYGKDTGSSMTAVMDAIAAMVAAIPEITIKDETNEFDDKEFKKEYEKIYRDAEEYATTITTKLKSVKRRKKTQEKQ